MQIYFCCAEKDGEHSGLLLRKTTRDQQGTIRRFAEFHHVILLYLLTAVHLLLGGCSFKDLSGDLPHLVHCFYTGLLLDSQNKWIKDLRAHVGSNVRDLRNEKNVMITFINSIDCFEMY